MAYARFFDSDIYIYPSVLGDICCCGCFLYGKSINIENDDQLREHLDQHVQAGHDMPIGLLQEILQDDDRYGAIS